MSHNEVVCRNSFGFWTRAQALEVAAGCMQVCKRMRYRVYRCSCCNKHHLSGWIQKVSA